MARKPLCTLHNNQSQKDKIKQKINKFMYLKNQFSKEMVERH
jgi:hypothetical protein